MEVKEKYSRHYEDKTVIKAHAASIFAYADDHTNFSSHMNKSSWMMGGGKMETQVDEDKGQKVGSHIQMHGKIFGINLFLDEVITEHNPPFQKAWETVGNINLIVIDHYRLGFEIQPASTQRGEPDNSSSKFRVYIDYNLPKSANAKILGYLLGEMYAKWCVNQMITGVREYFK